LESPGSPKAIIVTPGSLSTTWPPQGTQSEMNNGGRFSPVSQKSGHQASNNRLNYNNKDTQGSTPNKQTAGTQASNTTSKGIQSNFQGNNMQNNHVTRVNGAAIAEIKRRHEYMLRTQANATRKMLISALKSKGKNT